MVGVVPVRPFVTVWLLKYTTALGPTALCIHREQSFVQRQTGLGSLAGFKLLV